MEDFLDTEDSIQKIQETETSKIVNISIPHESFFLKIQLRQCLLQSNYIPIPFNLSIFHTQRIC